jgi:dTDP-4-amino-4,6-dideoxygalactose transaminase
MNIPFHKPFVPKSFDEIYSKSIHNGWLTTGPIVQDFENTIRTYTKSKYTIAVNSCTAALHLVLASKEFKRNDRFIAPTYTFAASVEVGEYLNMRPILIDCDDDYNIDLNQVEYHLKNDSSIKAIIPVHFAGKPVNMKDLKEITYKRGTFILEDAAHALETESNLGKVGNTNHAAAFSFYANKNITTAGEGGAVCTNDETLAKKIRKLSLHGMSKDGWKRFKIGAKWRYDVSDLGYKYNMTDLAASYGNWQMQHVDIWHKKRKDIFKKYYDSFSSTRGIINPLKTSDDEKCAYHLYIIRLDPSYWTINRDKVIELLNKAGVGTSVHYIPIHLHSYYQNKYGYKASEFPKASRFSKTVISLPFYPSLSEAEVSYIIDKMNEIWAKYKK